MQKSLGAPIDCKCGQLTINDWHGERSYLRRNTPNSHHSRIDSIRNPPADRRKNLPVRFPSWKRVPRGVGVQPIRPQSDQKPFVDSTLPKIGYIPQIQGILACIDVFRIWLSNDLGFGNLKRWVGGPAAFCFVTIFNHVH